MHEKAKINIREIADSDVDQVFSLHNMAYQDSRSSKDWLWEYRKSYPTSSVFVVAEDSGRIIGTQGMIPIYLDIAGERHLTGKSENTLLEKDYRGSGLFEELYRFALSECERKKMSCIWGFTNSRAAAKALRDKLHFTICDNVMRQFALSLDLKQTLSLILTKENSRVGKKLYYCALLLIHFYSSFRRAIFNFNTERDWRNGKALVERTLRTFGDINDLYQRLRGKFQGLVHIDLDQQYFNWRIVNNPNLRYKTYFLYEDRKLRAYCLVHAQKSGIAYLTDFTFEDLKGGEMLWRKILNDLVREEIGLALFMANVTNPLITKVLSVLKKSGFVELKRQKDRTSFVFKNIMPEGVSFNASNWYMNGLWTEGYKW